MSTQTALALKPDSEKDALITIKQLPIIEQKLESMMPGIVAEVEKALALPVNEETYKEVKRVRADLNKWLDSFESQRKRIKIQYDAPWDAFMQKYATCVSTPLKTADSQLRDKINEVEKGIKKRREEVVRKYFDEYAASQLLTWVTFDMSGIEVKLSDSEKSLKERCKTFIDNIAAGIALINTEDNAEEIMVEFKKTLNAAGAILTVRQRHEAIEAEKKRQEEREAAKRKQEEAAAKVEQFAAAQAPVVEEPEEQPEEELYTLTFTVTATMPKLKALKKFLIDGGYDYE